MNKPSEPAPIINFEEHRKLREDVGDIVGKVLSAKDQFADQLDERDKRIKELEDAEGGHIRENQSLKQQLTEAKREVASSKDEGGTLKSENEALKKDIVEKEKKIGELQKELAEDHTTFKETLMKLGRMLGLIALVLLAGGIVGWNLKPTGQQVAVNQSAPQKPPVKVAQAPAPAPVAQPPQGAPPANPPMRPVLL